MSSGFEIRILAIQQEIRSGKKNSVRRKGEHVSLEDIMHVGNMHESHVLENED